MEHLDDDEKAHLAASRAAHDFGEACAKFRDDNRYPDVLALNDIINTLMTELWDRGFSQTEIRLALQGALDDVNRYAAGKERR